MSHPDNESLPELPEARQNNFWYRYNSSDRVFVFVHGILSDSRTCWLYEGEDDTGEFELYWPDLIASDKRFRSPAIYLGGYYTAVDAGNFTIEHCASQLLMALETDDPDQRPPVMAKTTITFICHSLGGLVVRRLLVRHWDKFKDKDVALVLIASPSRGSKAANRLGTLIKIFNHQQGAQLRVEDLRLDQLHNDFKDLINDKQIPKLRGIEFCENHFILHRRWIPFLNRLSLVTEESAGQYFGSVRMLPNTDHSSACKPDGLEHPAHRFLVHFCGAASGAQTPEVIDRDHSDGTAEVPPSTTSVKLLKRRRKPSNQPQEVAPEPSMLGKRTVGAMIVLLALVAVAWYVWKPHRWLRMFPTGFATHFGITLRDQPFVVPTTITFVEQPSIYEVFFGRGVRVEDEVTLPREGLYRFHCVKSDGPKVLSPNKMPNAELPASLRPIERVAYATTINVEVSGVPIPVRFTDSHRIKSAADGSL